MAKYIRGTGRSKQKKTKKQYKTERKTLVANGGRQKAIAELQDENVIYMLAQNPVYIHSNKLYYEAGHKTAVRILNEELSLLVNDVHTEINRLIPLLDAELQQIITALGMNSWEEFRQWWSTEVQPNSPNLQTNSEALYYLALLEKIKKQATSIGTYLYMRNKGRTGKGGGMTRSGAQQLINAGFVGADFTGAYHESAKTTDLITHIREEQRKDIIKLSQWLVPHLVSINDGYAEGIITKLKSITGSNLDGIGGSMNIDQTFANQIGRIQEYISAMFTRELTNGIKVSMRTVAAERKGSDQQSATFKADTQIAMNIGSVQLSFLASDKTGMETMFGKDGRAIGYIDKFTAGIMNGTLNIERLATAADFNSIHQIDSRLQNIFHYVIKNADFFYLRDQNTKDIILALFAWMKLIVEVVGVQSSIQDVPVVIRMFNRLYRTSDILRMFSNQYGLDILRYVNKAYLNDLYNTYRPEGLMSPKELREIKKSAMEQMHGSTTYAKLKYAIYDTLTTLNGSAARTLKFSAHFRILLDNIENLKESM